MKQTHEKYEQATERAKRGDVACRQTCCKHCGQDIENFWPYRRGEWRDRGNNPDCPYPGKPGTLHAPVKD
jgi:hypothetical protein